MFFTRVVWKWIILACSFKLSVEHTESFIYDNHTLYLQSSPQVLLWWCSQSERLILFWMPLLQRYASWSHCIGSDHSGEFSSFFFCPWIKAESSQSSMDGIYFKCIVCLCIWQRLVVSVRKWMTFSRIVQIWLCLLNVLSTSAVKNSINRVQPLWR